MGVSELLLLNTGNLSPETRLGRGQPNLGSRLAGDNDRVLLRGAVVLQWNDGAIALVHPIADLGFAHQKVMEGGFAENVFQEALHGAPHVAKGTIAIMGADLLEAGVTLAELGAIEVASEQVKNLADRDFGGWPGEGVTARLSPNAIDEASEPEEAHKFGNVWNRKSFRATDFGNTATFAIPAACHVQETAKTVFFLGTEFHDFIVNLIQFEG
jgi:hypothetical protein